MPFLIKNKIVQHLIRALLDIRGNIGDELENFINLLVDLNILLEGILSSSIQKE